MYLGLDWRGLFGRLNIVNLQIRLCAKNIIQSESFIRIACAFIMWAW